MKVEDFISKEIQTCRLYQTPSYEESKLNVLDLTFFTNGNGVVMAQTVKPLEGGYPVDSYFDTDCDGKKVRQNDEPYGHNTYMPLTKDYFKQYENLKNYFQFNPYPISDSCLAYDIFQNNLFLQQDWLEALIFLCEKSLNFYLKSNEDCSPEKTIENNEQIDILKQFIPTFKSRLQ